MRTPGRLAAGTLGMKSGLNQGLLLGIGLGILAACGGPSEELGQAPSDTSVIYGDDDRRDVYQVATGSPTLTLAQSTVALVKKTDLAAATSGYKLPTASFGTAYGLCSEEPFREQPNPAFCSGFLVGPDLIATAGHCIRSASDCAAVAFVFDFAYRAASTDPTVVAAANVFSCKEIVATQAPSDGADFAVIRLDRAVTGRAPLAFRKTGKVEDQAPLVVIGHPAGLPTKIAGGAAVRTNAAEGFFVANLDTYGGNSGSAVFHATTGVVEGILVRGEQDFIYRGSCTVSNRCASGACRGEDVTRATAFATHVSSTPPPGETVTRTHSFAPLALAIPDNSTVGATQPLTVSQAGKLLAVSVQLRIKHTYIGDLQVVLQHPDGTSVTLHDRTGGSKDDLIQTFGEGGLAVAALASLNTKAAAGTWKVVIKDRAAVDVGKLESVTLTLKSQ